MDLDTMRMLANEKDLGAGNFLDKSIKYYDARIPVLFSDRPISLIGCEETYSISLEELSKFRDRLADWYIRNDVKNSNVVALYFDGGLDYLLHFLALSKIGAIAAFVSRKMTPEVIEEYVKQIGAVGIMTDKKSHKSIEFLIVNMRFVAISDKLELRSTTVSEKFVYKHSRNDTVLITHTSGTTGFPKPVRAGHEQFFYCPKEFLLNPPNFITEPSRDNVAKIFSAFPVSHNVNVAYFIRAVCSGVPIFVLNDNSPSSMLDKIRRFRPSIVAAFARNFVDLLYHGFSQKDVSSVSYWRSTGDSMHRAHISKFIKYGSTLVNGRFRQGSKFFDGLGSSEMCGAFSAVHDGMAHIPYRCAGKPAPWLDVCVFDRETKKKINVPYSKGLLAVKGPSVSPGYWGTSLSSEKFGLSGYFVTGDVVFFDEKGNYYQIDRDIDAIREGQENDILYSTYAEELILDTFPVIVECVIFKSKRTGKINLLISFYKQFKDEVASVDKLLLKINDLLNKNNMPSVNIIKVVEYKNVLFGVTGKVLKRLYRKSSL